MRPRQGVVTAALILTASTPGAAEAAKYAGEFLRLGMGARAWALGGAFSALAGDATATYWNPAGLAGLDRRDLLLMHSETFGSLLNYDAVAFALPAPRDGSHLGVGLALFRLGGGGIQRTALADESRPISDSNRVVRAGETVGHSDWAFYAAAGKTLSPRLWVGAALKLIYRDLVDVSALGFGFDLGARYSPHPSWHGAVVLYDATTTLLAYDNGTKESVNPRATVGLAFSPQAERFRLTLSGDAVLEFEGRQLGAQFYQGKISADLRWGAELLFRERIAFRGGLEADRPNLGIGLRLGQFSVDGAWRGQELLADSYRFSLSHSW